MFSKKSQYPIGLEISDSSLKLVQLGKIGDKIKIQALGKVVLPENTIIEGDIKNADIFKASIKEALSKPIFGSFSTSEVVASLPSIKTFIKLIKIEKTPNNVADIIETEIEKEIPVSLENSYYDWQIIEEDSNYHKVLVGVAPKNIVSQYIETLQMSKLSVLALEIESLPISRALITEESPDSNNSNKHLSFKFLKRLRRNEENDKNNNDKKNKKKNYGIIELEEDRTKMIIYARNSIITSIAMPISGKKVTKQISESLKIDYSQAEKAKIICGLDKNKAQGIISEILSSNLKNLISKIKMTIDFFESHYPELGPLDEILLCGSNSTIKDLDKSIEEALTIKTSFGNNFLHINQDPKKFNQILSQKHEINSKLLKTRQNTTLSVTQNSSQEYSIAIGLALRNIFICNE